MFDVRQQSLDDIVVKLGHRVQHNEQGQDHSMTSRSGVTDSRLKDNSCSTDTFWSLLQVYDHH